MPRPFRPDVDAPEYSGPYAPYDILKEGTIAFLAITVLVFALAIFFGSPDEPEVTIKAWATAAPLDFAQTSLSELNGTSISASYGAPYNTSATGQQLGPLTLAKWVGVRIPINSAQDFVIDPLEALPSNADLSAALKQWNTAPRSERTLWLKNTGSSTMTFVQGQIHFSTSSGGPIPYLISALTSMARSGALDQSLLNGGNFYTTDYTKPLLFISDSAYLGNLATKQHLLGTQWGMMNETGSYPGQSWLWLYTTLYQVPPMSSSSNADVEVFALMGLASLVLIFMPFIPGLRSVPRHVRLYRWIWREHYRSLEAQKSDSLS